MYSLDKWEAGGNGLLFTVSRKIRTNENVASREWWETRVGRAWSSKKTGRVRVFPSLEAAQTFADKLNKVRK